MGGGERGEFSDENHLLRSTDDFDSRDLDVQLPTTAVTSPGKGGAAGSFKDLLLKHLDRGFSGRRLSTSKRPDRDISGDSPPYSPPRNHHRRASNHDFGDLAHQEDDDVLADNAPPEWVLLLLGCLLGLASGLCVAAFNKGVHLIHEWAWAGTPTEGAAWLRLQRLSYTWHRILLIPVTGGVIVGMMHGLVEILDQIRQSISSQRQGVDAVAGVFPTIKAIQAAVTLGTGCSLGPEGPSVDIGKSCANGLLSIMENNREREIALVAAGAAAGIASGFNAAVAGCFFAIETVLRPRRAENSPPFTTAMIILASVISSTVSNVVLGTQSAFTVPPYDMKSAAELPLYLILGMLCGVVSVAFTRLVSWFTKSFEYIKNKFSLPAVVCPALGGLGAGIIALRYPGILYWGFTNVEEILHTGKSASAPGIWLLTQLAIAKVVATAFCKGSGLVGGLYAPSLMIGAAVGAVFGGSAAEVINSAIPGNAAVAQPQAYALVGMAATLASVCSVPLTSVLLLFELTKDYRIILPLMGAVGLAIWVPSVTNQAKESEATDKRTLNRGYSSLSNSDEMLDDMELAVMDNASDFEGINEDFVLESLKVSKAMSKNYVKVLGVSTLKEAIDHMHKSKQNCVIVVDDEDLLEGILTYGDVRRLSNKSDELIVRDSTIKDVKTCLVSSVCTREISYRGQSRGLLTCYPDTELAIAKELMEAKGIKQLPVLKRSRGPWKERKRRVVAILHYESIQSCLREEIARRKTMYQHRRERSVDKAIESFNAVFSGCFFAIETVLRPRRAENSTPFTTAMIILASVISSTVSNVLLGAQSAFTVPPYDLKSAVELPLYLILGMLCGVVSVAFTSLVSWFTKSFEYLKNKFSLPAIVCPALGGLGAGIIALRCPGNLYWGFTNIEEILHTGKSASAPGIWPLTQLAIAKVVATALCKGSGLVGGLYAPSLMIGAAVGAVFGGSAAEVISSAIPGNAAVAQPQAYALVSAKSAAAADAALAGLQGGFASLVKSLRSQCIELLTEIEAQLDFDDEMPPLDLNLIMDKIHSMSQSVESALETANYDKLLQSGIPIAIVGRPNVGKCSLLNAWSKSERAIVTNIAGTTRDVV